MDAPGRPLTKSSASDAVGSAADRRVTPHSYENQMVITGDNYAISQIHVDDIEDILLVTIDKVDRTQPFKLTIYFNTYGTSSASLDYITHILKKICHLDIHVGLFYHSEDAACVGYVNSVGAKRHFEYCPSDENSLPCIPKIFLDRFSIGENRLKRG
jgi:hypothetical protein